MMSEKLDNLFQEIKNECLVNIRDKHIDNNNNEAWFCFELGMDLNVFLDFFMTRHSDFSFYLKAYDLILNW